VRGIRKWHARSDEIQGVWWWETELGRGCDNLETSLYQLVAKSSEIADTYKLEEEGSVGAGIRV